MNNKFLLGIITVLLVMVGYLASNKIGTSVDRSPSSSTQSPSPTPTPATTSNPITKSNPTQTPVAKLDPIKIAKLIRDKFPNSYPGIPDEVLGNAYIKKYGTDELLPAYVGGSSNNQSIHCTTSTSGSYTYTDCY